MGPHTMPTDPSERATEVAEAARSVPGPERASFVEAACTGQPNLRAEVEALLAQAEGVEPASHRAPSGRQASSDAPTVLPPVARPPGSMVGLRLGKFHVTRVIASGGMGTVYEASQEFPRRVVALKVIRAGIASPVALRRFEYEAQMLARLRHPGIAQIYEAGVHGEGDQQVPYFAMEYIPDARAITDYAAARRSSLRQRMELFTKVCDAVHHGHQKGIIHRDLKPSNILVDAEGQPKIIDFGVAKATEADLAYATAHTGVGQLVGTLQYMSPEQCAADPHDLDTRSDVYALGVVLYELLCGKLPYDLSRAAVHEAVRVIREEPPRRPSATLRSLRGDVETITLRALEKDRSRRYGSAADLGADIQRYLGSEPIAARPPSVVYQVRMFARRNRALFRAGMIVVAALILGITGTTWGLLGQRSLRQLAEDRAEQAKTQARVAETVTVFLQEMLASADPLRSRGQEVTVRRVLDRASERATALVQEQPEVGSAVLFTLGRTYRALGFTRTARQHVEAALHARQPVLPEPDITTASLMYELGVLSQDSEGIPLRERALELRRSILGPADPGVLAWSNDLANYRGSLGETAGSETSFVNALSAFSGAAKSPDQVRAELYEWVESIEEREAATDRPSAARLIRDSMAAYLKVPFLRPDVPEGTVAFAQHLVPKHPLASRALVEVAVDVAHTEFGSDSVPRFRSLSLGSEVLQELGLHEDAKAYARDALAVSRVLFAGEGEHVIDSLLLLADSLTLPDERDEAKSLLAEALSLVRRLHRDDPYVPLYLHHLADALKSSGDLRAAEPLAREAVDTYARTPEVDADEYLHALEVHAEILIDAGPAAEAELACTRALAVARDRSPGDDARVVTSLNRLASALYQSGRASEAGGFYVEALQMNQRLHPPADRRTALSLAYVARCNAAMGRRVQAREFADLAEAMVAQCLHAADARRQRIEALIEEARVLAQRPGG